MRLEYFIYLHHRPDTNQVFYVGRGKLGPRSIKPNRAFSTHGRNVVWWRIIEKNNWIYHIELEGWYATENEVKEKEKELILKYGRKNLCNMTDGGEGALGLLHSDETKEKLKAAHAKNPARNDFLKSEEFKKQRLATLKFYNHNFKTNLGKKASPELRAKFSKSHKGKHGKLVINIENGIFYNSVEEAAESISVDKWSLYKYLKGLRKNTTPMRYADAM